MGRKVQLFCFEGEGGVGDNVQHKFRFAQVSG